METERGGSIDRVVIKYSQVPTVVCIKVRTASFPRFWKNHPECRKNDASYKQAAFFFLLKQKKIQNGRLRKLKMATSRKPHFRAPPILNIFS